mmetsp:Transcript_25288/g.84177  ORF Transcript_25288/g.84177 Transcript_25288/m.84177 type:complete len:283 (+) Transcript_25288:630-1478(+)
MQITARTGMSAVPNEPPGDGHLPQSPRATLWRDASAPPCERAQNDADDRGDGEADVRHPAQRVLRAVHLLERHAVEVQRADLHVVPPAVRHVVCRVCVLVAAERLPDHLWARQRRADGSHPRLANLGEEVDLAVHVDLRRRLVAVREQVGHHVVHAVHVHRGHHVDHAELETVGEAAAAEDHQPVEVGRRHGVVVPLLVHPVRHLGGEVLQHVAGRQRPLAARHRLLRRRHDQQLHRRGQVLPVDVGDGDEGLGRRVGGLHERGQVLDVREARERHRERNHH